MSDCLNVCQNIEHINCRKKASASNGSFFNGGNVTEWSTRRTHHSEVLGSSPDYLPQGVLLYVGYIGMCSSKG